MSQCLLSHERFSWTVTTNSRLIMMGASAVGGLLLIIVLAPWNYLQTTENNESVPSIPVEENLETSDAPADLSDSMHELNDSDNEMSAVENQPVIESESPPVIPDSPPVSLVTEAPANSDVIDNVVNEQQGSGSSSVTYSSGGGHGHRSSHSSNSNSGSGSEDVVDQEGSGSGVSDNVPPQEPDDGIDEDDSFFVLPESPIGSVLILLSSLASMGGFLAYRARRLA